MTIEPPSDARTFAFMALKHDAHVATADGLVLVPKGAYGRFRRDDARGWVVDTQPAPEVSGGE